MALRSPVLHFSEGINPMYSCEITCKNCGHMTLYTKKELWRIISIANDLEMELKYEGEKCNICGEIGLVHLLVRNEDLSLVIFEKIISPAIEKPPITKTLEELKKIYNPVNSGFHKPTMDNPCIFCCATGKINVQYKAHKKEGSFKGVLIEECPACDGKGYFN